MECRFKWIIYEKGKYLMGKEKKILTLKLTTINEQKLHYEVRQFDC